VPHKSASEPRRALTPSAEQVARFRRDLEALTGEVPAPTRKLGLAVSGGPDSVALLLLASAAYPGAVAAATVDHGLRPEAAEEAAFVHRLCEQLDVAHTILGPDGGPIAPFGNLLERARLLRYAWLYEWARLEDADPLRWRTQWIAIAHQRDDVAESFLMRARRGAGVGGLAAMPERRPLVGGLVAPEILRPLLGWGREELGRIVSAAGIAPVIDPSNSDARFDRARIRALLRQATELPTARLALSAHNLRHAEDALEWIAAREFNARVRFDGYQRVRFNPGDLPYELRRRLVRKAVDWWHGELCRDAPWQGTGLDRLVATLDAGDTGTIAGVKAFAKRGEWCFEAAPPHRSL
jgi:tRNA(Ile)-lysidine synthase